MLFFILFFLHKICFFLLLQIKFYCLSFKDQFKYQYYRLLKPDFSALAELVIFPLHFHNILLKYLLYDNKHIILGLMYKFILLSTLIQNGSSLRISNYYLYIPSAYHNDTISLQINLFNGVEVFRKYTHLLINLITEYYLSSYFSGTISQ